MIDKSEVLTEDDQKHEIDMALSEGKKPNDDMSLVSSSPCLAYLV